MQRMPTRTPGPRGEEMSADDSPMLRMARRIRQEQGSEQVKAFLAAMTPFSAPNEIRRIGESFGISFESIELERSRQTRQPPMQPPMQQPHNAVNQTNAMMNQINQLKMLMQLSGMMKNGGDPTALLGLLNNR